MRRITPPVGARSGKYSDATTDLTNVPLRQESRLRCQGRLDNQFGRLNRIPHRYHQRHGAPQVIQLIAPKNFADHVRVGDFLCCSKAAGPYGKRRFGR